MKHIKIFAVLVSFCLISNLQAQTFINKGMIEYEVKENNHKVMGDGFWADMMRDKTPKLSTYYYQLTFDTDKSIYLFNRKDEKTKIMWNNGAEEDNVWYNDYANDNFVQRKDVFGEKYLISDSLLKMNWKMTNETREIAGFNCRKAVGKLFDSVYVFAFYTDEITVSGGPMSLHGLPGMILGITIPRMFTSWVATKVEVNGVDTKKIVAPTKGKKRKAKELQPIIVEATKDWGSWGRRAVWNIFL